MIIQNTFLHLSNMLDAAELGQIGKLCEQAEYQDGKITATGAAREVKENLQLSEHEQAYMSIQQLLLNALNRNALFRNALFPQNVYPFLISKYNKGMSYGWHVDSPVMGNMMRTDIAMTIFLNDPAEYEGGELELQTALGSMKFKLTRGDAICYPCQHLHRVNEVTGGQRHVAVTWIQSLVRAPEQRKILFELQQVTETLRQQDIATDEVGVLQQHYSNLLRMWAY
jgi:PKHD-type hydroxylase